MNKRRSLLALLMAEAISTTGSQMSALAIPWFVLVTTGSPARMGIVMAVDIAPMALLGIPAGALAGRLGARRTMLISDLARVPLITLIPVLHLLGLLSFPLLLANVFAVGLFSAPYFGAQHSILPELFGEDEGAVGQAASLLQGATRTTLVLGPGAAGLLISIVGPLNVLLIDAATFLVALLLVGFLVKPAARHQVTDVSPLRILDGLRHLLRDGLLRAMLASSLLREPAHQALFVAIPFLVITRFGKHPELVGLFTAAWAGGAVAGSGAGCAVLKRLNSRKVAILGLFGQALPLWVLPLGLGTPVIVAALAISGICNTLTAAPLSAVRSLLTPPSLRPQVNTAAVTVAMLAGVIGAGVAGPALQAFSLAAVLAAVAALLSLGALVLLRPLLRSEHADTSHVRTAFRGTGAAP